MSIPAQVIDKMVLAIERIQTLMVQAYGEDSETSFAITPKGFSLCDGDSGVLTDTDAPAAEAVAKLVEDSER